MIKLFLTITTLFTLAQYGVGGPNNNVDCTKKGDGQVKLTKPPSPGSTTKDVAIKVFVAESASKFLDYSNEFKTADLKCQVHLVYTLEVNVGPGYDSYISGQNLNLFISNFDTKVAQFTLNLGLNAQVTNQQTIAYRLTVKNSQCSTCDTVYLITSVLYTKIQIDPGCIFNTVQNSVNLDFSPLSLYVTEIGTIQFSNYFIYNDPSVSQSCIFSSDASYYGTYSNTSVYYNSPPEDVNLIDVPGTPFFENFNGGYNTKNPTLEITAASFSSADLPFQVSWYKLYVTSLESTQSAKEASYWIKIVSIDSCREAVLSQSLQCEPTSLQIYFWNTQTYFKINKLPTITQTLTKCPLVWQVYYLPSQNTPTSFSVISSSTYWSEGQLETLESRLEIQSGSIQLTAQYTTSLGENLSGLTGSCYFPIQIWQSRCLQKNMFVSNSLPSLEYWIKDPQLDTDIIFYLDLAYNQTGTQEVCGRTSYVIVDSNKNPISSGSGISLTDVIQNDSFMQIQIYTDQFTQVTNKPTLYYLRVQLTDYVKLDKQGYVTLFDPFYVNIRSCIVYTFTTEGDTFYSFTNSVSDQAIQTLKVTSVECNYPINTTLTFDQNAFFQENSDGLFLKSTAAPATYVVNQTSCVHNDYQQPKFCIEVPINVDVIKLNQPPVFKDPLEQKYSAQCGDTVFLPLIQDPDSDNFVSSLSSMSGIQPPKNLMIVLNMISVLNQNCVAGSYKLNITLTDKDGAQKSYTTILKVQLSSQNVNLKPLINQNVNVSEPFIVKDGFVPTFKNPIQIQIIGTFGQLIIKFNYKVIVPKFFINTVNNSRELNDEVLMLTDLINPEIIELKLDEQSLNWTCVNFLEDQLQLKIFYQKPLSVSNPDLQYLTVNFLHPEVFITQDSSRYLLNGYNNYQISGIVPLQFLSLTDAEQAVKQAVQLTQTGISMIVVSLIIQILAKKVISSMWFFYAALQILLLIALNGALVLPPTVHSFVDAIRQIVQLDAIKQIISSAQESVTETSKSLISKLGGIGLLVVVISVAVLVLLVLTKFVKNSKVKKYIDIAHNFIFYNFLIRYFQASMLNFWYSSLSLLQNSTSIPDLVISSVIVLGQLIIILMSLTTVCRAELERLNNSRKKIGNLYLNLSTKSKIKVFYGQSLAIQRVIIALIVVFTSFDYGLQFALVQAALLTKLIYFCACFHPYIELNLSLSDISNDVIMVFVQIFQISISQFINDDDLRYENGKYFNSLIVCMLIANLILVFYLCCIEFTEKLRRKRLTRLRNRYRKQLKDLREAKRIKRIMQIANLTGHFQNGIVKDLDDQRHHLTELDYSKIYTLQQLEDAIVQKLISKNEMEQKQQQLGKKHVVINSWVGNEQKPIKAKLKSQFLKKLKSKTQNKQRVSIQSILDRAHIVESFEIDSIQPQKQNNQKQKKMPSSGLLQLKTLEKFEIDSNSALQKVSRAYRAIKTNKEQGTPVQIISNQDILQYKQLHPVRNKNVQRFWS